MIRTARRVAAACLLLAATGSARPDPQSAGPPPRKLDEAGVRAWVAVVNRHEPGIADAAAVEAATPSVDAITNILNDVVGLIRGRRDAVDRFAKTKKTQDVLYGGRRLTVAQIDALLGIAPDAGPAGADRLLMRAVLLYSDAAEFGVVFPTTNGRSIFREDRPTVVIADGQGNATAPGAYGGVAALWAFARLVADEVGGSDARDRVISAWYRAVGMRLQRDRQWGLADAHVRRGLDTRSSDPVLLFERGVVHEFYAGSLAQGARQTVVLPAGARLEMGDEVSELREAETSFRQAAERDPALAEAHLRRGHVLGSLGNHDAARRELLQAQQVISDRKLNYYVQLFLGRSLEALGEREQARASFEQAASAFPLAQSPLLSLSELARRSGDVPAAVEALQRLLALPAGEIYDPWWEYDVVAARRADALMSDARRVLVEASR